MLHEVVALFSGVLLLALQYLPGQRRQILKRKQTGWAWWKGKCWSDLMLVWGCESLEHV